MTDLLSTPLRTVLAGGATKVAKAFDYHTVEDLLRHFPRRYQRLDTPTRLSQVQAGEHTTILARVVSFTSRPMRQRRGFVVNVSVTDDVGTLPLTFFAPTANVLRYWEKSVLRTGQVHLFDGRAEMFRGKLQLTHPRILEFDPLEEVPPLLPIYPATKGLDTMRIRRAMRTCLAWLSDDEVPDPIPAATATRRGLPPLHVAFRLIHEPAEPADHRRAVDRFRYEEALVAQTALVRRRVAASLVPAIARPARPGGLVDAFDLQLPFRLTDGQRGVGAAISDDLAKTHPMHRLLQGEVGSGKTVVALRAMLAVVDAGGQATLLAPTEVLALQHFRTISGLLGELGEWTNPDGVRVALLTGAMGAAARRNAVGDIGTGHASIVIGTHALLSETVHFADLGLVVVDEQHRFGVEQRDALRDKAGQRPHLLVMTATPIPRTVAMTVFGDLEVSTLTEIPSGRSEVVTHVVDAENEPWMTRIWQRVAEEVAAGRQTFVVCARIGPQDEAETLLASAFPDSSAPADRTLRGVLEVAEELRSREELSGLRIEVVYGRQPTEERDHLMRAFAAGQVDVLVATTVIEVGVDMPGASMMVVFDADRFGVSQLHQLRGRIGRGAHPGLCLLVDGSPAGSSARERLDAVAETADGFQLAEVDLHLRREGDVLGAAQSGAKTSLRLLRVARDAAVIAEARDDAAEIVGNDVAIAQYPALRALIDRFFDPQREAFFDRA